MQLEYVPLVAVTLGSFALLLLFFRLLKDMAPFVVKDRDTEPESSEPSGLVRVALSHKWLFGIGLPLTSVLLELLSLQLWPYPPPSLPAIGVTALMIIFSLVGVFLLHKIGFFSHGRVMKS